MKFRKLALFAIGISLVASLAGWNLLSAKAPATTPTLARVETGTVSQTVLASGMLEAAQLVSVGALVSGQMKTLAVNLGDKVNAGDLVAEIDSQDQRNTVLQAEAALAQIEAQLAAKKATLERAEKTLARQQKLKTQNYAAQDTIETATADVLVYRADLDALEAQKSSAEVTLDSARTAVERTRIIAPIGGTIVAVVVKQGQTVSAAQSAPTIVKIADLSTMLVKVEISEADVMNVAPGQRATFTTLGAPGEAFTATVKAIEPAPTAIADSDTISSDSAVYYNGLLEVANPEGRLRIGMSAEVSIELARADDVLTVPSSAVKSGRGGKYVEIYDPASRSTDRRPVTVGLNDKVVAEITDGLKPGESVVIGTQAGSPARPQQNRSARPPMMRGL